MEYGIKISAPGKDVNDPDLETYEYQAISTRNALKEKAAVVTNAAYSHGVTGGIPLAMNFQIVNASTVKALGSTTVSTTQITQTFNRYVRVFYNKQTEA